MEEFSFSSLTYLRIQLNYARIRLPLFIFSPMALNQIPWLAMQLSFLTQPLSFQPHSQLTPPPYDAEAVVIKEALSFVK